MKNLILDIKYYLLFLMVITIAFYLYLNFGGNFGKNYAPEIISDTSFLKELQKKSWKNFSFDSKKISSTLDNHRLELFLKN